MQTQGAALPEWRDVALLSQTSCGVASHLLGHLILCSLLLLAIYEFKLPVP